MKQSDRKALAIFPVVLLIGALLALAGSSGGSSIGVIPTFTIAVGAAIAIQWIAFIPSFIKQTERFYDITGTLTYVSITVMILLVTPALDARSMILGALVLAWTLRLGIFLFRRISKAGKDDRFDALKPSFIRFLNVWTIQGLWVTFTAAAAWVAMTSGNFSTT